MKKIILSIIALLSVTVMEAQKNQTHLTLNNGVAIPQFGLGVYSIPAGEVTYNSVLTALKAGYRHIDTAHAYRNERSVGQAIKDSDIPRDSIWVTSKLWPNEYGEEVTPKQLDKMLERLGLEYIDLVYLHQPLRDYNGGWRALEKALEAIDKLDVAIDYALNENTRMGAYQARIKETIDTLETRITNNTDAQSTIADADMAKEMIEYAKTNMLSQSSQAMFAQANKSFATVLSLLQ